MIKDLKKLMAPGIAILTSNKEVTLLSSNNLLQSVERILLQLPDNTTIKIIPESDATTRSILLSGMSKEYKDRGYNVVTMVPEWSCRIKVREHAPGCRNCFVGQFKAYVEVYNSYQSVVVGVFSNKNDAEAFKNKYYNPMKTLIYSTNKETKEFYEMSQMRKRIPRIN